MRRAVRTCGRCPSRRSRPTCGLGVGPTTMRDNPGMNVVVGVHSTPFDLLVEYGVVGALPFFVFVYRARRVMNAPARGETDESVVASGVCLLLLCGGIYNPVLAITSNQRVLDRWHFPFGTGRYFSEAETNPFLCADSATYRFRPGADENPVLCRRWWLRRVPEVLPRVATSGRRTGRGEPHRGRERRPTREDRQPGLGSGSWFRRMTLPASPERGATAGISSKVSGASKAASP
jgi:hypothetical protein